MRCSIPLATAILCILGVACSDTSNVAGGTGTGTDNTVAARRLSIPLDSAMDALQGSASSPVPLLLRFDTNSFVFDSARDDGADLQPTLADGRPLPFVLRDWSKDARQASLWIRLDSFRRGAGDHIVLTWGRPDAVPTVDPTAVWLGIPESLRLARASILVSDFESGTGETSLPCRCNAFYTGEKDSGALVSPRPHAPIDSSIGPAGGGRDGKALHVVYSATGQNYALVGTRLGRGTNRLAGLDSITLWIRGTGAVLVALENRTDTTDQSKAWKSLKPDSLWRRFSIRPSEFDQPAPYARGWEAVKDSVNALSLFLHGGGEMWIDDIRLHGLAPSEIP